MQIVESNEDEWAEGPQQMPEEQVAKNQPQNNEGAGFSAALAKPVFEISKQQNYHIKTDRVVNSVEGEPADFFLASDKESGLADQTGTGDLDHDLICPICMNLLLQPQDCLACDTSFCQACIADYIAHNSQQQQQNRLGQQWQLEDIVVCPLGCPELYLKPCHKRTKQKLNQLKINCRFTDCDVVVSYSKLPEHEMLCRYNIQRCKNFELCRATIHTNDMAQHLSQCRGARLQCKYCKVPIESDQADLSGRSLLSKHEEFDCELNPTNRVKCAYCDAQCTRKEFCEKHLMQCEVLLRFQQLNCKFQIDL